jgi:hypothetical protein
MRHSRAPGSPLQERVLVIAHRPFAVLEHEPICSREILIAVAVSKAVRPEG